MPPSRTPLLLAGVGVMLLAAVGFLLWIGTRTADAGRIAPFRHPADVEPLVEATDPTPLPTPTRGQGEPRVTIDVRPRARLVPVEHPPACEIVVTRGGVPQPEASLAFVAGSGAWADRPPLGRQLVRVAPGASAKAAFYRVVGLFAARAIEIELGRREILNGTVFGPDGEPVPGATVWAGEITHDGVPVTAVADADGRFEFATGVPLGGGVPVVVRAERLAPRVRAVDFAGAGSPVDVHLVDAAGPVTVQLAARIADPSAGCAVVAPAQPGVTLLRDYPFFLSVVPELWGVLGRGAVWPLDANGRAQIDDLPVGVEVAVWVHHDEIVVDDAYRVRTDARRGERVVIQAARRPTLRGRTVDPSGETIADARLSSWAARDAGGKRGFAGGEGMLLPPIADRGTGRSFARADPDGDYVLARVHGEPDRRGGIRRAASVVRASAPGRLGVEIAVVDPERDLEHDFVLPEAAAFADREGDPLLRVHLDGMAEDEILVREHGGVWRPWIGSEPIDHGLREPSLVDVTVTIARAGVAVWSRTYENVPVFGSSDLHVRAH